ncbi:MAG: hypothetical protein J0M01_07560 [Dechloromonas sp.]|jgi:hypothetical protein|nr:hypothetical protein [Dechloromonas sp.]
MNPSVIRSNRRNPTHAEWREAEARRAVARAEIDARLDAVRYVCHDLSDRSVIVASVDLRIGEPGKPLIRVEARPRLHVIFAGECSSGRHWDADAGCAVHDFRAPWHGCEIAWSEVEPRSVGRGSPAGGSASAVGAPTPAGAPYPPPRSHPTAWGPAPRSGGAQ